MTSQVSSSLPLVTVIMPVRNEAAFIERALRSVLRQDYPAERLQLIVADGMSEDGTREVVRGLSGQYRNLQLVDNVSRTASSGLNAGLRLATGEIVVRVDGHCEIAADFVRRCVEHLLSGKADGVGGPIETIGETRRARAIARAMSSRFGVGNSAFRTRREGSGLVDTVPFPAYRRSLIERAGPFDEEQVRNQDDEYNYRLREQGARILLAPDVRSRYYSRSTFGSLGRQYFQYGFWKVRVLQKHPRQMRMRQFVPPLFVAALMSCTTLAALGLIPWRVLGMLLAVYGVAGVAASVWAAGRAHWRLIPLILVAFPTLHLAYGAGFLCGLVRFWNRWGTNARTAREQAPARGAL